jgi:hypothetical protein
VAQYQNNKKSTNENGLTPPPDIAWLWHCHRLAPYKYEQYCRETFGEEPFEAYPAFSVQHEEEDPSNEVNPAAIAARQLWDKLYPNEPFFPSEGSKEIVEEEDILDEKYRILCGFDLVESTECQQAFLWQVTQPRFQDTAFLHEGVQNYYKFLKLRATAKGQRQIIVPTYQIDLMWHTHMLSSLANYNADCRSIIGRTLHHDDSLNDRSEGSTLDISYRATEKLWYATYGTRYAVPGGMYRGEPPEAFFDTKWSLDKIPVSYDGHIMMGASSTGAIDEPSAGEWLDPSEKLNSDGWTPGFIDAAPRSHVRGRVANPQKADYVFGTGSLGPGYYHIRTKDSYSILLTRIDKKIKAKKYDLSWASCCASYNPICFPHFRIEKARVRQELDELETIQEIIRARSTADVPLGVMELPESITKDPIKTEIANKYNSDNVSWLYPTIFYTSGGGCGAIINDCGGGGCGGGGAVSLVTFLNTCVALRALLPFSLS